MSIIEQNKQLIERYFYEVWNEGKLNVLDQIMSEDYINHSPGAPNPPLDLKDLNQLLKLLEVLSLICIMR